MTNNETIIEILTAQVCPQEHNVKAFSVSVYSLSAMKLLKKYLFFDLSAGVLFVSCIETIFYSTVLLYLLNTLIHLPPELKKTQKQSLAEQNRDAKSEHLLKSLENIRNRQKMWEQQVQEIPRNRSYRIEATSGKRKRSVSADYSATLTDPPEFLNYSASTFSYPKFEALRQNNNFSNTENGLFVAMEIVSVYLVFNVLLIIGYFKRKATFVGCYAGIAFATVFALVVFMGLFIALAIVKEDDAFYRYAALTPIGMIFYGYNGLAVYSFYMQLRNEAMPLGPTD